MGSSPTRLAALGSTTLTAASSTSGTESESPAASPIAIHLYADDSTDCKYNALEMDDFNSCSNPHAEETCESNSLLTGSTQSVLNRNSAPPYRHDIDGLRAISVVSVILYHLFPSIFPNGYYGVDVFFVISGFVITRNIHGDFRSHKFSIREFYLRRILRIFPPLLVLLLATMLIGSKVLFLEDFQNVVKHVAGACVFYSNILLYSETGYFDTDSLKKPLLHLWSLSVEEQFYILWPLCYALFLKMHSPWIPIVFCIILSFVVKTQSSPEAAFYLPYCRFWQILAGSLLHEMSSFEPFSEFLSSHSKKLSFQILDIAGLTFCVSGLFLSSSSSVFLPISGACIAILFHNSSGFAFPILNSDIFQKIGKMSYGLYMYHWPPIAMCNAYYSLSPEKRALCSYSSVAPVAVLTFLSYEYLENRVRKGRGFMACFFVSLLFFTYYIASSGIVMSMFMASSYHASSMELMKTPSDTNISGIPNDILTDLSDSKSFKETWRYCVCHIQNQGICDSNMDRSSCIEPRQNHLVLLWGDSGASSLYHGLLSLQKKGKQPFQIAQLTQAACPYLLDLSDIHGQPQCNEINKKILSQLPLMNPDVIVLHSVLKHPDFTFPDIESIKMKWLTSIHTIRSNAPRSRIVILGPAPLLLRDPQACIFDFIVSHQFSDYPFYVDCIDPDMFALDGMLRVEAWRKGFVYFSTQDIFCKDQKCQGLIGRSFTDIFMMDKTHWTKNASVQIASFIEDAIMP